MYELDLYNLTYDKLKWEIKEDHKGSFYIKNLEFNTMWHFIGDIIGICQVSENEFLIHKRIMRDIWHIDRVKLSEKSGFEITRSFKCNFHNFTIFPNNTILFDSEMLYDVKRNEVVEAFNWLKNPVPGFKSKLDTDTSKDGNSILSLTIYTTKPLHREEVVAFIDTENLQIINNEVFSTLQGRSIRLGVRKPYLTLEDLVTEDSKDAKMIHKLFSSSFEEKSNAIKNFKNHLFN